MTTEAGREAEETPAEAWTGVAIQAVASKVDRTVVACLAVVMVVVVMAGEQPEREVAGGVVLVKVGVARVAVA